MRKKDTQVLYENYLKTNPDIISTWESLPSPLGSVHWKIIKNQFPYDALPISRHDLLIPKRHFSLLSEATPEELSDLVLILSVTDSLYSYSRQNNTKGKTVPGYFHIHLIRENGFTPEKDIITDSEDFADTVVEKFKSLFHTKTSARKNNRLVL